MRSPRPSLCERTTHRYESCVCVYQSHNWWRTHCISGHEVTFDVMAKRNGFCFFSFKWIAEMHNWNWIVSNAKWFIVGQYFTVITRCARWLQSLFCRRDRQSNERRESNARKTLKHTNNNKSNNKSGKCLARRRTTYRRTPDVEMVEWFDHNTKYENERRKGMNEKLFCKRRRRTALRQRERRGEREREIHFAVTKR